MTLNNIWPKNIPEAKKIQESLRKKVKITPIKKDPEFIAGVDAAFIDDKVIAVASLYKYPELVHIEDSCAIEKSRVPYVPGFLSFREGHAIISALKKLRTRPGLILFDGQGIAHPKGIGIASHIGVILNIPAIGCAKSRLVGDFQEPGKKKGSQTPLFYKGKRVGSVLRTRDNVKPLFVSPGHRSDIESSGKIVLRCVTAYRIPEPVRMADIVSRKTTQGFFNVSHSPRRGGQ